MERKRQPSRIEILELDLDIRLSDLWAETLDVNEWDLEKVAAFMRAAYGKGYCDAIKETAEDRGQLLLDHGYKIPPPSPTPPEPGHF